MSAEFQRYFDRLRAALHLEDAFVRVRARALRVATLIATALVLLVLVSTMSGSNASLAALTGRALLVFGFLLTPAALDALAARSIGPFVPGE